MSQDILSKKESVEKIGQDQLYGFLMKEEMSWQEIIYDLINSEQLDPWDINLLVLTQKYVEKIKELEEMNFFVSSKVLLVASLLLRIKSQILLNKNIKSLDDILFGKKEDEKYQVERIEIDEDKLPTLFPRTPLPRFKKISLDELMGALNKAVDTENRRITREILSKRAAREADICMPKRTYNLNDKVKEIYSKLKNLFENKKKIHFDELVGGNKKEDKIATFIPLLHLDNQEKVWLEQNAHLDDIWVLFQRFHSNKAALDHIFNAESK